MKNSLFFSLSLTFKQAVLSSFQCEILGEMYLKVDKSTEEQVLIVGLILNLSVLDFNRNLSFLPLESDDDLTL